LGFVVLGFGSVLGLGVLGFVCGFAVFNSSKTQIPIQNPKRPSPKLTQNPKHPNPKLTQSPKPQNPKVLGLVHF